MATKIYESETIYTMDNTAIYMTPLKIKYLRQFLEEFDNVKKAKDDDEAIELLTGCAKIAMQQYRPDFKTIQDIEDNFDLKTIYQIINIAAGIKIDSDEEDQPVSKQAEDSGATWESLDLAKLESEVFLLGIWKDYDDLETSLSMSELTATLTAKRELDYSDKKFHASIQGIDLDKNIGKKDAWEEMKARVFSGGQTADPNDVLSFQGVNAQKAGFGIGMGLSYEKID
jgi:hypothetical protein